VSKNIRNFRKKIRIVYRVGFILFIKTINMQHDPMNGVVRMTKELALSLLSRKGVYLTSEGKRILEVVLQEKNAYKGN